jgi:Peptidase A4 family
MNITRLIRRVVLSAAALAVMALIASFATEGASTVSAAKASTLQQAASENWAGYDVTGRQFSSVSGTWTQPQAGANPTSSQSYSAFWVGLGGTASSSSSLEQVGTASDYVDGHAQYYAWYELVPAGQQRLNLAIHPGDKISARTTVNGTSVTVSLTDQTTGKSVTKTLQMSNPDTSSAEWIAEAPASQSPDGSDQILPLSDFGKVTFTNATASAGGHTGGVSDPDWSATRIELQSGGSSFTPGGGFPGFASSSQTISQSTSAADTSTLSGDSFSVTWQSPSSGSGEPSSSQSPGSSQFPGTGYPGYPGGYAYGGYPGGYVYVYGPFPIG